MQGNDNATFIIVSTLVAFVLPWVIELVKAVAGTEGSAAKVWVAYGTIFVVTITVSALTGDLFNNIPWDDPVLAVAAIGGRLGWVVMIANAVYNANKGKYGLGGSNPHSLEG